MNSDALDPQMMERVALLIERISINVDRLARSLGDVNTQVEDIGKEAEEALEKTSRQVYDVKYETEEMFKNIERRALPRVEFGLLGTFLGTKTLDRALEESKRKMSRWADEMRRHMEARGPLFGGANKMTGLTSAIGGMGALKNQLFAGMPGGVGGLIGMALWGATSEERFEASARKALYTLRRLGQTAEDQIGDVRDASRAFYQEFGEEGTVMLNSITEAFSEFSVGKEQFASLGDSVEGFGNKLGRVTLALDLASDAAVGTTARLIGEAMTASGASIEETTAQVKELHKSLYMLGLNYAQFSQGIVQANSALRMQNQSLGDTEKIFQKLYTQLRGQGLSKQQAGAVAMERLQAGAQGVQNVPEGLAGLLAQGLKGKSMPGFAGLKDSYALMTRYKLGLADAGKGEDQNFMSTVFGLMREQALRMAGVKPGQEMTEDQKLRATGALASVGQMSLQSAKAIIDYGSKTKVGAISGNEKTEGDWLKSLNATMSDYSKRQSGFEVAMRKAQDELAQIGGDILAFLIGSFENLFIQLSNLGLRFKSIFKEEEMTNADWTRLGAADTFNYRTINMQDEILQTTMGRINKIIEEGIKLGTHAGGNPSNKLLAGMNATRARYNKLLDQANEEERAGLGLPPRSPREAKRPRRGGIHGTTSATVAAAADIMQGAANEFSMLAEQAKLDEARLYVKTPTTAGPARPLRGGP